MRMTFGRATRIALAVALTVAAVGAAAQAPPPQPPQPARGGPASAALNYVPGVGDLMNLLVQPRHAKLGIALQERNWDLAGYALKELQQAFGTVATVQPKYRNLTVAEMIESMTGEAMRGLDDTIRARDPRRSAEVFDTLTDGCNSCHTALGYPFVVIKPPDGSSFPNQDFKTP
jgi:hypothetical protein